MRQIMSNTQKSDFLSRVVARCWIQRHLCFHGSHSKSASYSLQQRNKLESKSRSLFVTFICTRMHMHAHRQGDNELPTPAAASMPVRWFTVHQEMGRCSCKFWARAGAWFVSWTSWTKMFRGTFFIRWNLIHLWTNIQGERWALWHIGDAHHDRRIRTLLKVRERKMEKFDHVHG